DLSAFRRESPVAVHTFPALTAGTAVWSPGLVAWLEEQGAGYDVIHVHGLLNLVSSLAARKALRRRFPLVICPFGTMSRYTYTHRRRALKRVYLALLDRPNLRRAAALHFCTGPERDEAAWHGIPLTGRSFVIPPPLADPFRFPARDVSSQSTRVLFLSRIHPKKGLEVLLDAWPMVRSRLPQATLTIAGDGDRAYVESLRARADTIAGGSVSFTGFVSGGAKNDTLANADLFVLPSFQENFGVVVIEAISAGAPVVITPEVQLAPVVESERLGFVVPRRADAVAEGIVKALGDRALRDRVASRGAAIVEENFSLAAIGRLLAGMYADVTTRHHPRSSVTTASGP
ncbi:MAG TPA: glycosyltransferase, partial [Polyangia bacterium]|nr:glycosyltransferase [Polyangia bacterium]